eukprot:10342213-Ditylum_brightwellii.AAC.1
MVPTSSSIPLGPDPHGKETQLQHKWNYVSVVGMLMYLASNSRPEISFAVYQGARFTNGTKHSNKKAILHICRYLKGTSKDGLIIKPTKEFKVDC